MWFLLISVFFMPPGGGVQYVAGPYETRVACDTDAAKTAKITANAEVNYVEQLVAVCLFDADSAPDEDRQYPQR